MKLNISESIHVYFMILLLITSCSFNSKMLPEDESVKIRIRECINDYSSDDWSVRLASIKEASRYGDTVYAKNVILLMLLAADDYHPAIQIEAIKSLQKIKPLSAMDKFRELALNDNDMNVRRAALTALQDYSSPENEDVFLAGIESSDWLIREAGFIGLLRITPGDIQKKHIEKIISGINDSNISVRIAVLTNIKIKDPLLYNEISEIINNKSSGLSVLKAALIAVKGYRLDDETRERLLGLLTHRNKDLRLLSLQALKQDKIELNYESDLLLH